MQTRQGGKKIKLLLTCSVRHAALAVDTGDDNYSSVTVSGLSAACFLSPSLYWAVPLKTDMKTKPGHSGAPEAGPPADAATHPPPSSSVGPRQ